MSRTPFSIRNSYLVDNSHPQSKESISVDTPISVADGDSKEELRSPLPSAPVTDRRVACDHCRLGDRCCCHKRCRIEEPTSTQHAVKLAPACRANSGYSMVGDRRTSVGISPDHLPWAQCSEFPSPSCQQVPLNGHEGASRSIPNSAVDKIAGECLPEKFGSWVLWFCPENPSWPLNNLIRDLAMAARGQLFPPHITLRGSRPVLPGSTLAQIASEVAASFCASSGLPDENRDRHFDDAEHTSEDNGAAGWPIISHPDPFAPVPKVKKRSWRPSLRACIDKVALGCGEFQMTIGSVEPRQPLDAMNKLAMKLSYEAARIFNQEKTVQRNAADDSSESKPASFLPADWAFGGTAEPWPGASLPAAAQYQELALSPAVEGSAVSMLPASEPSPSACGCDLSGCPRPRCSSPSMALTVASTRSSASQISSMKDVPPNEPSHDWVSSPMHTAFKASIPFMTSERPMRPFQPHMTLFNGEPLRKDDERWPAVEKILSQYFVGLDLATLRATGTASVPQPLEFDISAIYLVWCPRYQVQEWEVHLRFPF